MTSEPADDSGKLAAEGRKLFEKKQYAEAAAQYRKMLEGSSSAVTTTRRRSRSIERRWLDRADEARASVATALAYDPVYASLNQVLDRDPDAFGLHPLARHRFAPPRGYFGKPDADGITVYGGDDDEWRTYATCKAVLRNEPAARKAVLGDAEEVEASFEEERACGVAYVNENLERTRARLEKAPGKNVSDGDVRNAAPPLARHLVEVLDGGLLDGYVAFEILGQRCPITASMYPEETSKRAHRRKAPSSRPHPFLTRHGSFITRHRSVCAGRV